MLNTSLYNNPITQHHQGKRDRNNTGNEIITSLDIYRCNVRGSNNTFEVSHISECLLNKAPCKRQLLCHSSLPKTRFGRDKTALAWRELVMQYGKETSFVGKLPLLHNGKHMQR